MKILNTLLAVCLIICVSLFGVASSAVGERKAITVWSLSNLMAMLRYNLFTYRDLWTWMDQPFEPPPVAMLQEQLSLNWTA